jgi:hypothetical protein
VFTLRPVLPMRAAFVAGAAATLGLLALASLPSTADWPNRSVVQPPFFRALAAASVVHEPLALARADNLRDGQKRSGADAKSRQVLVEESWVPVAPLDPTNAWA